jgi:hypothetical protein
VAKRLFLAELPVEVRLKPLVKGALSVAVPPLRTTHHARPASTASGAYCYSMFLRHYSYVTDELHGRVPEVVAEFGPGSSIGMGLAALIAGASVYYGLDTADHTNRQRNLEVFDELVGLFRARARVPDDGIHKDNFPLPVEWSFPESLTQRLEECLAPSRLDAIRNDLRSGSGHIVRMSIPWTERKVTPQPGTVGWLFSHAVLQHLDDPEVAHRAAAEWLAPGGVATHEIDYGSLGLTRPYLANRLSHSQNIALLERLGFEILREELLLRDDGVSRADFNARFRSLTEQDTTVAEAFVACRLRGGGPGNARRFQSP